jgi:16S rRNA (cytosine1402-N4)-methyltransferase
MVNEVVDLLHIKKPSSEGKQALFIDGTLGTGGHALEILKNGGKVLGIDLDPNMIEIAKTRISKEFGDDNYKFVIGNFSEMDKIAAQNNWGPVSGILLDLGVSNLHLKDLERGFSFANREADLDMRLNPETQGVKASDLLNILRRDQLEELFKVTMDGGPARWLVGRIIDFRNGSLIQHVGDFLEICQGLKMGKSGLSEATLPFLALRIAVNSELDNLKNVLPKAYGLLETGGRLVVISFHSGEDKIVKDFMIGKNNGVNTEIVTPSFEEVNENPRARSAKIRVVIKI